VALETSVKIKRPVADPPRRSGCFGALLFPPDNGGHLDALDIGNRIQMLLAEGPGRPRNADSHPTSPVSSHSHGSGRATHPPGFDNYLPLPPSADHRSAAAS